MLELKNISKTFFPGTINEKKALRGVDLHMETGDFITIIGGNGAGKSRCRNINGPAILAAFSRIP